MPSDQRARSILTSDTARLDPGKNQLMDPALLLDTPSLQFLAALRKTVRLVGISTEQNKITGPNTIPEATMTVETHLCLKALQLKASRCQQRLPMDILLYLDPSFYLAHFFWSSSCYLPAVSMPTDRSTTHLCGRFGGTEQMLPAVTKATPDSSVMS